jgi:hypothetical protein
LKGIVERKVEKHLAKVNVRHVVAVSQQSCCRGCSRQPKVLGGPKRIVQSTASAIVDQTNVQIFFYIELIHQTAYKLHGDWGYHI